MLSRLDLQALVGLDSDNLLIASFYLNVDGRVRTPMQYVERAHQLLRDARLRVNSFTQIVDARLSVQRDLDAIEKYIGAEFERTTERGLAIFSCTGAHLWQVWPLTRPLKDELTFGLRPDIRQLSLLLDDHARYGVAMVDREDARFFVVELGAITETAHIHDDTPRRVKASSYYGMSDRNIERHVDDAIHNHLKHTAGSLTRLVQRAGLKRIILAGTDDLLSELMRTLPRTTRAIVVGTTHLPMRATVTEVLDRTQELVEAVEERREQEIAEDLLDQARAGGFAVLGPDPTLRALYHGAVQTLVVDRELTLPGYVCAECGRLYESAPECPECRTVSRVEAANLVVEAIDLALAERAEIDFISGTPDLIAAGGIGGLLRYHLPPQAAVVMADAHEAVGSSL